MPLYASRLFGAGLAYGCMLGFAPWAVGKVIEMFRRITNPDEERKE